MDVPKSMQCGTPLNKYMQISIIQDTIKRLWINMD